MNNYGICIESSHQRGMGHLFRAINFIGYLKTVGERYIVFLNDDAISIKILKEKEILYQIVDYSDEKSNWEEGFIKQYEINVWLLDKFCTSVKLCEHVKKTGILLAGIDDTGEGAGLIDIHFYCMLYKIYKGRKIYKGEKYIVLNPEIATYRRVRREIRRILVTLGGSDTYGATLLVVEKLREKNYTADILTGPNFRHMSELKKLAGEKYSIYQNVSSLIEKMSEYDLAITGGGVTPIEACASGLPCIIVANEMHEIELAEHMQMLGVAVFAGYYKEINDDKLVFERLDIEKMSNLGLETFTLDGAKNIYEKIKEDVKYAG